MAGLLCVTSHNWTASLASGRPCMDGTRAQQTRNPPTPVGGLYCFYVACSAQASPCPLSTASAGLATHCYCGSAAGSRQEVAPSGGGSSCGVASLPCPGTLPRLRQRSNGANAASPPRILRQASGRLAYGLRRWSVNSRLLAPATFCGNSVGSHSTAKVLTRTYRVFQVSELALFG